MVTQQQYGSSHDIVLDYSDGGDFTLPDEGSYIIEFLGVIDTKDWPRTDKGGNPVYDEDGQAVMDTSLTLQFRIEEDEEDYPGVEFRDYFPLRVTAGNKSGRLWAAFWGVPIADLPKPMPKVAQFVGRQARANIIHRDAKNGNSYAKIASVVPLKKKRQAPVESEENDEQF